VDEAAGNVEGEAEKPQDQKDYEDCPKHIQHLSRLRTPGRGNSAQAHTTGLQATVSWQQRLAPLRLSRLR
jgi:hypothetical protein